MQCCGQASEIEYIQEVSISTSLEGWFFLKFPNAVKSDILPKHKILSHVRKVEDIFPSDSLLKFAILRRAFTYIWNSLPAKPDAPRTSVLCEEALSYVSSHLYYFIFADFLYALCWFALLVCLNSWYRMNPPLNIHGIKAEKLITLKLCSGFTWLLCKRQQLWYGNKASTGNRMKRGCLGLSGSIPLNNRQVQNKRPFLNLLSSVLNLIRFPPLLVLLECYSSTSFPALLLRNLQISNLNSFMANLYLFILVPHYP